MTIRIPPEEVKDVIIFLSTYYPKKKWKFEPQEHDSFALLVCSDRIEQIVHAYLCGYRIPH